jgi:hypothetical protein
MSMRVQIVGRPVNVSTGQGSRSPKALTSRPNRRLQSAYAALNDSIDMTSIDRSSRLGPGMAAKTAEFE